MEYRKNEFMHEEIEQQILYKYPPYKKKVTNYDIKSEIDPWSSYSYTYSQ